MNKTLRWKAHSDKQPETKPQELYPISVRENWNAIHPTGILGCKSDELAAEEQVDFLAGIPACLLDDPECESCQ